MSIAADESPAALRSAMVDQLVRWGSVRDLRVEAAMRAVPRHRFVPGATVQAAYAQDGVVTHPGADGRPRSMASAPAVVAQMLEQLDVQPGHRVLEIGAGTGYNAALAAHLAGPAGAVTTIDIDQDVADGARTALAASGFDAVRVVCGDGEYGHPQGAPYARIIATAGAWEVPAAWTDQLAAGGRIVVPLRVRGLTRSVALERQDGVLVSRSLQYCGFIPIRGAGHCAEPTIRLREDPQVSVRLDDGMSVDAGALRAALEHRPVHCWLSVNVVEDRVGDVEFWLASADGFCRLLVGGEAAAHGLVEPMYRWGSMAVVQHGSIGYLTMRTASPAPDGRRAFELGVCSYGPVSDQIVADLADRIGGGNARAAPVVTSRSRCTRPGPGRTVKSSSPPTSGTPALSCEPPDRRPDGPPGVPVELHNPHINASAVVPAGCSAAGFRVLQGLRRSKVAHTTFPSAACASFRALVGALYQPHCEVSAWTSSRPRPLSWRSSGADGLGGAGQASSTSTSSSA
ncbi:methyltransferase, FxLD system [Actinomadura sp. NPDC048955]|uniref:methyltransferase, FxLD system n=1 Tax=Actinomadura sp. NPDC048955 TaxID=3158228 RepID=UPI0033C3F331